MGAGSQVPTSCVNICLSSSGQNQLNQQVNWACCPFPSDPHWPVQPGNCSLPLLCKRFPDDDMEQRSGCGHRDRPMRFHGAPMLLLELVLILKLSENVASSETLFPAPIEESSSLLLCNWWRVFRSFWLVWELFLSSLLLNYRITETDYDSF